MRGLRAWAIGLFVGAAVVAACGVARADNAGRTRGGLSVGAGYGKVSTSDDRGIFTDTPSTPDDFATGITMGFDMEYLAATNIYVELMMTGWIGTVDGELGDEEWSAGMIAGGLRWYPVGEGFFVRAGFGAGGIKGKLKPQVEDAQQEFDDFGLGLLASAGYDIIISDQLMTGPMVDLGFIDVGDDVRALGVHFLFTLRWR